MLPKIQIYVKASIFAVLAIATTAAFGQSNDKFDDHAGQVLAPKGYTLTDLRFDLLVKFDSNLSVEQIALILPRKFVIKSRERGTSIYKLRAETKADIDWLRGWCQESGSASVIRVIPVVPNTGVDLRSHFSISEFIEAKENTAKKTGEVVELDYLESLVNWIKPRAFPYASVDHTAYERANTDRLKLDKTTRSGPRALGATGAAGPTWEFIGPTNLAVPHNQFQGVGPVNGRINALAVDPNNPDILYAGAAAGGVFKSYDGGNIWVNISENWKSLPVNCITLADSNTIFVGLGDQHGHRSWGTGVMKSTNGGQTWTLVGSPNLIGVSKILIDPDNANNIVCTTTGYDSAGNGIGKIFRSTDRGETWKAVQSTGNIHWTGLTVSLKNSTGVRAWYAAASAFAANRIYRSLDGGASWTALKNPAGINSGSFRFSHDIAASKVNSDTVYFLAPDNDMKILKSVDRGATWTDISAGFPNGNTALGTTFNWNQGFYDYHINCSLRTPAGGPATDMVYVGLNDLNLSIDGGKTWTSVARAYVSDGTAKAHCDQHSLVVSPSDPNTVFFSNDGGVYRNVYDTASNTHTVTSLNGTLGATMFYDIAVHPTNANIALGGAQDNANPYSRDNLASWINVGAGDGCACVINQDAPAQQYFAFQNMNIYRTNNYWSNWFLVSDNSTFSGDLVPFNGPIVSNEANRSQIYAGTNYLNKYDPTTGWTRKLGKMALAGEGSMIKSIASHKNGKRLYTGSDDGLVYMSNNAGTSWKCISNAGLPLRSVMTISISPTADNDILVGLSGTGSSHVYRCSNTDAANPTWTNVSGSGASSLPDISVNTIARDLASPTTTWWIGTDIGVFQTKNSGSSWSDSTQSLGLPCVGVNKLVAVPGTQFLFAATYGRGLWRLSLAPIGYASFVVSPNSVIGGSGAPLTGVITFNSTINSTTTFNISCSDPGAVQVPTSVTVYAGSKSIAFPIMHSVVSSQRNVGITVQNQVHGQTTAILTIRPQ